MTDTSLKIPGYRLLDRIYNGTRTQVYRAISQSDQKPVVIKILLSEYPTFNELVQFRNQYTITKNLDLTAIVKPLALSNYRNGFALVMEDFGGISLSEYTALHKLSIEDFLPIAIQTVQGLEGLYRHRIIHKDIKPQNILINPNTKEIKIIDFSISSLLPRENQEITSPNVLEGTLMYMSPEQTGRMNRGIDYLSDFYSLGITFYEILTGELPFKSTDPMELVHSHLARIPTPPIELVSTIPIMVNDIIMKLMAKNPESRYQSAFGLRLDLENCWLQWQETGQINQFAVGSRDICDRFTIPEKLYGRETEVSELLAAFDRVANPPESPVSRGGAPVPAPAGGVEIMLVAGFSGIGKTAAVNEVHKPIVGARGYFIKGKFDQFKRDIPFSAWVQSFQNLMRQLLAESNAEVQKWQAKILEALGDNGQVIIDVIPELEYLIGKQPKLQELEGIAAQNRFNLLFGKFIGVFPTKEHPLVIFLDDLQWADSASLKLMQLLVSETDTRNLLLIGAYRDHEVFGAHPLILTLDELRKNAVTVNQITLSPLDKPSLNHLIADTLSCPPEQAVPLTEQVFAKTQGNPFFATQFLKSLHDDGLITFDLARSYWQCDIAQVRALALTDDVVEFMAIQLQKLPINTQKILKLAACIGNKFDLSTLAIVNEKSQAETATDLWRALQEGLIIPITEVYKFFQESESVEVAQTSDLSVPYKFLHDRVQQAAYSLIPQQQKQATHLHMGRLLLQNFNKEEQDANIFTLVNHWNQAIELIADTAERDKLIAINLSAGQKARGSAAYEAASEYFKMALSLLNADSWQTNYSLALQLHEANAEVAYLTGSFEFMDATIDRVLDRAKCLLDRVKVNEIRIQALMARCQQLEAIDTGLRFLAVLGIETPESIQFENLQAEIKVISQAMAGKTIADLVSLPLMEDANQLAKVNIIANLLAPCYQAKPSLFPWLICKLMQLSIQYGNTPQSAFSYACYGMVCVFALQDFSSAREYGKLACQLDLSSQTGNGVAATFVAGSCLIHHSNHVKETLPLLLNSYKAGLDTGIFQYGGYAIINRTQYLYLMGDELSNLKLEMAATSHALTTLKQGNSLDWSQTFEQAVLNLLGESEKPWKLVGTAYDETKSLPVQLAANDRTGLHYIYLNKLILCYLFGRVTQAVENAALAESYLDGVVCFLDEYVCIFYDSLSQLACYDRGDASIQARILEKVQANQVIMQRWAINAPMNAQHKYNLVAAEYHRVLGERLEAMEMYDRAISLAQENEYINEEALAHELAAKFYLEWGKEKIARVYLTDAYYAYTRWGALAKVEDLEKRYPELIAPIFNPKTSLNTGDTIAQMMTGNVVSTTSGASEFLDLATVIKASQSLSEEIHLDRLLSILVQVAIENAGAQTGAMILGEGDSWAIATQCVSSKACNTPSTSVSEAQKIPNTIINYVWRTQETLVINDATAQTTWAADSYIIQQQPKSVLCLPIQHQGKAIGILYLENNLTTGAFTPDRLAVLKVLASQAAISIENAQLYANLETKVAERTQKLSQALSDLEATQEGLIQSEKMAALGQLVAGVAHEVNTPLGAIRSSAGNVSKFLNQTLEQLPALFQSLSTEEAHNFLNLLQRSLEQQTSLSTKEERKLKRALRSQLQELGIADSDTAADRLVMMGVYSELDSFVPLLQKPDSLHVLEIAYKLSELKKGIATINTATDRASKVVFALKTYAHYEQSGEKTAAIITEGIETILTLYHNHLKQGVEVIKNYAEIPPVMCYPDELNQVWTNLIHNALQAMDYRGTLKIELMEQSGQAKISITDSGKGITEEIKSKIFDPFFTTKRAGEGSGLGLDIVKKIVDKHQGKIEVESIPGQTTFHVFLPMNAV